MPPSDPPSRSTQPSIVVMVVLSALCRLVINLGRRFPYPFAPVLSRGMGVPLSAVTSLIAINQGTSMLGVFFGPISDRIGHRPMMLTGLSMASIGLLLAGITGWYGAVLLALLLTGLGKSVFDPSLQAYISARVPYQRRGLVIGVMEFSWAACTLIGIPLLGLVIEHVNWRAPFWLLGTAAVALLLTLAIRLPRTAPPVGEKMPRKAYWQSWKALFTQRPARAAMMVTFLVTAGNDNLFVVYGVWFEDAFALSVVALGAGTAVIGAAEFIGECLTATISDRLGLKRAVTIGLLLTTGSYLLLPLMDASPASALSGLFIVFLCYEYAVVTMMSLYTELMPANRATMMAAFFAAGGLGRVAGALAGHPVWQAGGIAAVGAVSAGCCALCVIVLHWGLRTWQAAD